MISKNIEIHGADKISKLRTKNAAFQATKNKQSGYTMDDFIKDFPNSNAAKKNRSKNRSLHPDLNKVLGRKPKAVSKESYEPVLEDYDAYDIVLNYLLETNQANTIEEANYVMLEMDSPTIKDIVWEYAKVNEGMWTKDGKYIDARGNRKPQESGPSGPKVKDKPSPSGPRTGGTKPQPPKGGPDRPPLADPPREPKKDPAPPKGIKKRRYRPLSAHSS